MAAPHNIALVHKFEQQFEQTKKQIRDFDGEISTIKKLHDVVLSTDIPDPVAEERMASAYLQIKMQNGAIRENFKVFEDFVKNDEERDDAYFRIKEEYDQLLDSYLMTVNLYQEEQQRFKEEARNGLKQHLNDPDVAFAEEEVEEMLEKGNFSAYMKNYAADIERNKKYFEIAVARHRHLLLVQQYIDELGTLMAEYGRISANQGEGTKAAEANTESASVSTEGI